MAVVPRARKQGRMVGVSQLRVILEEMRGDGAGRAKMVLEHIYDY